MAGRCLAGRCQLSPLPLRQEQGYEHPAGQIFTPTYSLTLPIHPCTHSAPLHGTPEVHRACKGVRATREEGVRLAFHPPVPHSRTALPTAPLLSACSSPALPTAPRLSARACCLPLLLSGLITLNFTPSLTNCPLSLISASEPIFYSLPFFFLIALSPFFFF